MNINLQYGSVAERAFKRIKRITAWDRLEIHDWMHDVDLKNLSTYEELRALAKRKIQRLRKQFCSVISVSDPMDDNMPYMAKQVHDLEMKVADYRRHAILLSDHLRNSTWH